MDLDKTEQELTLVAERERDTWPCVNNGYPRHSKMPKKKSMAWWVKQSPYAVAARGYVNSVYDYAALLHIRDIRVLAVAPNACLHATRHLGLIESIVCRRRVKESE